jgi:hypothetical protein
MNLHVSAGRLSTDGINAILQNFPFNAD